MKKISVIILIITIATTSIFAGNGHFGIGVDYAHNTIKDKTIPTVELKSSLDSAGIQLNSYTMFGKYFGIFGNTLINYGFKYNFETNTALGAKNVSLGVKDILAIDGHTMFGLGGRIPFSDSISLLLGLGGAAGATYIKKKDPIIDFSTISLGLGLGFDAQLRVKGEEKMGFSAGVAGNIYFKYYNYDTATKEFKDLKNTTGFVINPYIMVAF